MKSEFRKMSFSRALLAGVFCGFFTSIAVVLYTLFYREETDFNSLTGINPTVIYIAIPALIVIAGIIYFLLVHNVAKGELLFIALFAALLIFGVVADMNLHPSSGGALLTMPEGLLFGMEIITGLAICLFLPYLAHHPKIYMTEDQMEWEK